uniref:Uncharacterized protein n=1 Tax=Knipowitschia caucasica TaxID=637954 RepID=A0AAV2J2K8_KNICA
MAITSETGALSPSISAHIISAVAIVHSCQSQTRATSDANGPASSGTSVSGSKLMLIFRKAAEPSAPGQTRRLTPQLLPTASPHTLGQLWLMLQQTSGSATIGSVSIFCCVTLNMECFVSSWD